MQATETQGLWWVPETPDRKVYGTLSCSESGGLRLATVGVSTDVWPTNAYTVPVMLGRAFDGEHADITLRDLFLTRESFSGRTASHRLGYFANRGYYGAHLVAESDLAFGHATVTFSGLDAWASGYTGLSRGSCFSNVWTRPEPIRGDIPGGHFLLAVDGSTNATGRERRLREEVVIALHFSPAISEAELVGRVVHPLQNFLTLATDGPVALKALRVSRGRKETETILVVGPAVFTDDAQAEDPTPAQMLFTVGDVGDRLDDVIRRWLDLSERYAQGLPIYFAGLYRPPNYNDVRFSLVAQALALFHLERGAAGGRAGIDRTIGDTVPPLPAELRRVLDSHPVVGVERALTALMAEHASEFGPLAGVQAAGRRGFRRDGVEHRVVHPHPAAAGRPVCGRTCRHLLADRTFGVSVRDHVAQGHGFPGGPSPIAPKPERPLRSPPGLGATAARLKAMR